MTAERQEETALAVPFSVIPPILPAELWPGVVYLRTATLLAAPGGTGKGLLIARMAATVTTGAAWPGEPPGTEHEPGTVLLAAPEDDANEDLAWRLKAAGADLKLVRNLTYLPDGSRFTLPQHLHDGTLERAIAEPAGLGLPETVMVALDPLTAMTGISLASVRASRSVMDPLLDLARLTGTAIVVSHHTTKAGKIAGSKALTDAARMVWMLDQDKASPDGRGRIMYPWKSNRIALDRRISFRIEGDGQDVRAVFPEPGQESSGARDARLRIARPETRSPWVRGPLISLAGH